MAMDSDKKSTTYFDLFTNEDDDDEDAGETKSTPPSRLQKKKRRTYKNSKDGRKSTLSGDDDDNGNNTSSDNHHPRKKGDKMDAGREEEEEEGGEDAPRFTRWSRPGEALPFAAKTREQRTAIDVLYPRRPEDSQRVGSGSGRGGGSDDDDEDENSSGGGGRWQVRVGRTTVRDIIQRMTESSSFLSSPFKKNVPTFPDMRVLWTFVARITVAANLASLLVVAEPDDDKCMLQIIAPIHDLASLIRGSGNSSAKNDVKRSSPSSSTNAAAGTTATSTDRFINNSSKTNSGSEETEKKKATAGEEPQTSGQWRFSTVTSSFNRIGALDYKPRIVAEDVVGRVFALWCRPSPNGKTLELVALRYVNSDEEAVTTRQARLAAQLYALNHPSASSSSSSLFTSRKTVDRLPSSSSAALPTTDSTSEGKREDAIPPLEKDGPISSASPTSTSAARSVAEGNAEVEADSNLLNLESVFATLDEQL